MFEAGRVSRLWGTFGDFLHSLLKRMGMFFLEVFCGVLRKSQVFFWSFLGGLTQIPGTQKLQ